MRSASVRVLLPLGSAFMKATAVLSVLLGVSCGESRMLGPDPEPPAATVQPSALATLLDAERYEHDLPALAGAIVTADGVIDTSAVGCRRYGGPANVTVDDRFHLGSNGKALTATLIGVLVDEGRLSWTSPLSAIFPEHAATMLSVYRDVTLVELLSHTSGLPREPAVVPDTGTPREQRAEVLARALTEPPVAARGRFQYSNLDYIIAATVAEKATDRSYEELLVERVLQPLGITTAGFGAMGTPGLDDQPLQHSIHHAPIPPGPTADEPPTQNPAGRVHMSIGDWGRFVRSVLAAETGQATLLRPETARRLTTEVAPAGPGLEYALGWYVVDRNDLGGRSMMHGGSNGLNYSLARIGPRRGFAVIVATNICAPSTPQAMETIVDRLIAFHLAGK